MEIDCQLSTQTVLFATTSPKRPHPQSGLIPLQMLSTLLSASKAEMSNSKYITDAVSKMGNNKWLYLNKVKIKITLPFFCTQLLIIHINEGIKGRIVQNKGQYKVIYIWLQYSL